MATTTNYGWSTPDDTGYVKDGALNIRTLGSAIDTTLNKGLLAWVAYTPTWTNVTKGTGSSEAYYYCTVGKTTTVRGSLTLGTGGSFTGSVAVTLPANIGSLSVAAKMTNGIWAAFHTSTYYNGVINLSNDSKASFWSINASGTYSSLTQVTTAVPFTWTVGDQIYFQLTYESA